MKNIPNIITIIRIFLSTTFMFIKPYSITFCVIYVLCGISDILDGYIARNTNTTSKVGSILYTLAGIAMVAMLSVVLLPTLRFTTSLLSCLLFIIIIRII